MERQLMIITVTLILLAALIAALIAVSLERLLR